jgi:hypothetical protein
MRYRRPADTPVVWTRRDCMDLILYFTTFVAVATLFASAIAVLVLVLFKLFQASRGFHRKLRYPETDGKPAKQIEFEGWHPAHLKRAGQ